jgi:inner membrane protein
MKPLIKIVLIGALLVALAIPVMMLQGLVYARQQRGIAVAEEIAGSSSRSQQLVGPLLRIEVERLERRTRMFEQAGATRSEEETVRVAETRVLTPRTLRIDGDLRTEVRKRGIFEALVYLASLRIDAEFDAVALPTPPAEVVEQRIVRAAWVLAVGDARGVRAIEATLGHEALAVEPGTGLAWAGAGVSMPFDPARLALPTHLILALDLAGTQSLHWQPVADDTQVTLRSAWAHPSFVGSFLPDKRTVSAAGFEAAWRVSNIAAQAPSVVAGCGAAAEACAGMQPGSGFGVQLIDPVDRYLKTDRAIKYAWLFIVLVFGAVFFLELLRPGVRVHPLQYGLTGLALAVFFLLLLSLSEHIGFGPAYLVAATACVGLVTTYLATPLGGWGRAAGFGALLAGLYGLLYGLLQSEDYALLMGSLALFALLGSAMLLTRRLDWYGLGAKA